MSQDEQPDQWNNIETGLYSTSLKRRSAAAQELLAKSQEGKWTKEEFVHTCDIIFGTLLSYDDPQSNLVIDELVKSLASTPDFVSPFLAQWTRTCTEMFKRATSNHLPKTLVKLFRWSIYLFLGLPDTLHTSLDNPSAFSSITSNQSLLLSQLASNTRNNQETTKSCSILFRKALKRHPPLFDKYYNCITSLGELNQNNGILVAPLYQHEAESNKGGAPHKAQFLEHYIKIVLLSPTPCPTSINNFFIPLLRDLTVDELNQKIVPAMGRVLRRTPESVLGSVIHLIHNVRLDADNVIEKEIFPVILPCLKSTNEKTRESALELIRCMVNKSTSTQTMHSMAQQIVKIYKDKLSATQDKVTVATAVNKLLEKQIEDPQLCSIVVTGLCEQIEAETNDDARLVEMNSLSKWLKRSTAFPEKAAKILQQGTNSDKEALRIGALDCIRNSLDEKSNEKSQKASSFLPNILKIAKTSKGTPDGTLAMLLLNRLSLLEASVETAVKTEKLWNVALKLDAPVLKPTVISKLKDNDVVQLSQLLSSVVAHNIPSYVPTESEEAKNIVLTLLRLGLHTSHSVRKGVRASISAIHGESTTASALLVQHFAEIAHAGGADPKELRYLLMSCLSHNLPADKLPQAVAMVNHPQVSGTSAAECEKNTKYVLAHIKVGQKEIEEHKEKISDYIRDILADQRSDSVLSGLQSARSLSSLYPSTFQGIFTNWLCDYLTELYPRLSDISKYRLGVYKTPEGTVYDRDELEEVTKQQNIAAKAAAAKKKPDGKAVPKKTSRGRRDDRREGQERAAREGKCRQKGGARDGHTG